MHELDTQTEALVTEVLRLLQSEKAVVQLNLEGSQQSQEHLRQQLASRSSELAASQAAQEAVTTSLQTIKV